MSEDFPSIECPVRHEGRIIGKVKINPDGTFDGVLVDRYVHAVLIDRIKHGFANGISVSTSYFPAQRD